jgi:ribosome-associated toxin RatA of RatAB toxin-antitoxin module
MLQHEESITINTTLKDAFSILKNVKNYGKFAPEFRGTRIFNKQKNQLMLEHGERAFGILSNWIWKETIDEKRHLIRFEQRDGLLKGSTTEWKIEEVPSGIRFSIVRRIKGRIPLIGKIAERYYNNLSKEMTHQTLLNLKEFLESKSFN